MQRKHILITTGLAVSAWMVGCATAPTSADLDQQAIAMIKASFREQGIAKTDRLTQDLGQAACSGANPPPEAVAEKIQAEALASVKWPEGGKNIADCR